VKNAATNRVRVGAALHGRAVPRAAKPGSALRVGALTLVAALAWGAAGPGHAEEVVDVICSAPIAWCEAVAVAFNGRTGIKVNVTQKEAAEAMAQVAYERNAPRHDVWYAGSGHGHLQAANLELTEAYQSPRLADLYGWAVRYAEQSRWHSVAIDAAVLVFGVNRQVLAKKRFPGPACWTDLTHAEYHDALLIGDPHTTSAAYVALATLVQLFGEERAFEVMKGIHANVSGYRRTESGTVRAVARGEGSVGVSFLHEVVAEIVNRFPVAFVVPCEGTGYDVDAMSIIKGARHAANAKRFYDWALTPDAQKITAETRNFELPSNKATPQPPAVPPPTSLRLIPYDFAKYGDSAERQHLLDRWDREVFALPR
jgi:iron(III) transport system substrate-binding protein